MSAKNKGKKNEVWDAVTRRGRNIVQFAFEKARIQSKKRNSSKIRLHWKIPMPYSEVGTVKHFSTEKSKVIGYQSAVRRCFPGLFFYEGGDVSTYSCFTCISILFSMVCFFLKLCGKIDWSCWSIYLYFTFCYYP
jgi:hypothetical protein